MKTLPDRIRPTIAALLTACIASSAWAQVSRVRIVELSANVIVPQSRSMAVDRNAAVQITGVSVDVSIVHQVATTTMDISLLNPSGVRQEAELLVPVPERAAVRGFTFQGAGAEPSAKLLPKDEAVATYKAIVAKMKDPAILEFAGYNMIRSSVFPVEPKGEQRIRLVYEHLLPADGERVDYVLPRTESIDYAVPWTVTIKVASKEPISTVYSPSHAIDVHRPSPHGASVRIDATAMHEPGPLQISLLRQSGQGVTASLLAYPDVRVDGGYFLLLAGLPPDRMSGESGAPAVKRQVTIVIDRSGSMAGDKLRQAKEAALAVVDGLYDGEAVNVIDYSDSIASFAAKPVKKNKDNVESIRNYIRRLRDGGGTNIHDALLEALRPKPSDGMLPIVLFLTDGLPTVGVRDEVAIRDAAAKANKHAYRVFTFGVGFDVNAPLLTHLARKSRAVGTFVLPNEEIEDKVSRVYRRLFGPVLSEPKLTVLDPRGEPTTQRVAELMPDSLPDLFEGDKLVLLGQYKGDAPLRFQLEGTYRGRQRKFQYQFHLDSATAKNGFVPRLWATRKIAVLVDEIRQAGAESSGAASSIVSAAPAADPKMKELVDQIVRLSVEYGIPTEYTAFLAREGSDLAARGAIVERANRNLIERAQQTRSGKAAVNQAFNNDFQLQQLAQNRRNYYLDQDMNRVQISRVQQINDRGFFQQGDRWVDGNAINRADAGAAASVDRTVTVGSPEFMDLLEQIVADGHQGALSMSGEVLLRVGERNVLIKGR